MNRTKHIILNSEITSFRKNIINLNNCHRLIISDSLWKTFKCDKYNRYFYRSISKTKNKKKWKIYDLDTINILIISKLNKWLKTSKIIIYYI
jgi:hypothetical protein